MSLHEQLKTKLLRRKQVQAITGVPPSSMYAMIARRQFPAPYRLGGARAVAWRSDEIEAWINSRPSVTEAA